MALRDLVMGGGACVVPDPSGASSSSNPLGGFADSLLGSASKTQEKVQELPGLERAGPSLSEFGGESLASLPGSEFAADGQNRATDFGRRWGAGPLAAPAFDQMTQKLAGAYIQQPLNMNDPPQRVLSGLLQSFLHSSRAEAPFRAVPLPELGLSQADKRRIRDRSSIMSRHMFAERGEEFVDAQVNALLQSLDIENNLMLPQPMGGRLSQFEDLWNESQRPRLVGPDVTDQWAQEFSQHHERFSRPGQWAEEFNHQYARVSGPGQAWAEEYHAHSNPNAWADQFEQYQHEVAVRAPHGGQALSNGDALEETRSLVQTLSQNQDPKFQNSKFLQFVSKMSRGELIVEDNQVRSNVANGWANDFERQQQSVGNSWASDFTREHQHRGDRWADEFAHSQRAPLTSDDLVKDFTRLQVQDWADEFAQKQEAPSTSEEWVKDFTRNQVQDWADEFSEQIAKNPYGDGSHESWLDSYDKFVEQQVAGEFKTGSSKWVYVFAEQNPYVGHPSPLKEGQELFRRGLLSEAVLALEAEVLKNPDNTQGWRLLGITHAENDDDKQAIASMVRARDAEPTNLEVLLALGVGHTNELEQQEALHYLRGWLQNHPRYGKLVPPDHDQPVNHVEVVRMVSEAALMSPEDGDVHTVLGVLYNLSREYDRAIGSFQTALQLKPRDYSLWNKLGATQANSSRSVEAIAAYQQALDLKPNYVRAWSNMGIGYANQGIHDASIRYYIRALSMNPKADNVWDYLKISLSSIGASRDVFLACENRQLDVLQKEFPL